MSAVISISTERRYGVARVCRVWGVARAGIYRGRRAAIAPPPRPGPVGAMSDADLVEAIRQVLAGRPFHGEGYRKVWARLRHAGLRTSKERVLRLMRENGLQAATRIGRPRGPRSHDGTIIPDAIDAIWGTDMTAALTFEEGQVAVFVAVDHCSAACVGIHAALHGTRHEALEPIRQGVTTQLEQDDATVGGLLSPDGTLRVFEPWYNFKRGLNQKYGLQLSFSLQALYQSADETLTGVSDAAATRTQIQGAWTLLNRGGKNTGRLTFRLRNQQAWDNNIPPTQLAPQFGSIVNSGTGFSDAGHNVAELAWRQSFADGDFRVIGGSSARAPGTTARRSRPR